MAKSSSGLASVFFILTTGAVSFYSGFRPWLFGSPVGQVLLALALLAMPVLVWALRKEKISWRGAFSITAILFVIVIVVVYVPLWLAFNYATGPRF